MYNHSEKMRQIMFLDIDGVLNVQSNSYTTSMHRNNLCEPHLVQRLNYLCTKIEDLEIVISSSWRRDMIALEETLKECGFKFWEKVIGRTSVSAYSDGLKRGEQIHQWLKENVSETFLQRIDAIIYIVDDERYGIEEFWEEGTFFVDGAEGLSDRICNEILKKGNYR